MLLVAFGENLTLAEKLHYFFINIFTPHFSMILNNQSIFIIILIKAIKSAL